MAPRAATSERVVAGERAATREGSGRLWSLGSPGVGPAGEGEEEELGARQEEERRKGKDACCAEASSPRDELTDRPSE